MAAAWHLLPEFGRHWEELVQVFLLVIVSRLLWVCPCTGVVAAGLQIKQHRFLGEKTAGASATVLGIAIGCLADQRQARGQSGIIVCLM